MHMLVVLFECFHSIQVILSCLNVLQIDERMVECVVNGMDILVVGIGIEMAPRRAWRLKGNAGI